MTEGTKKVKRVAVVGAGIGRTTVTHQELADAIIGSGCEILSIDSVNSTGMCDVKIQAPSNLRNTILPTFEMKGFMPETRTERRAKARKKAKKK